jgi:uncharacterized protein (TIGR01244 family)
MKHLGFRPKKRENGQRWRAGRVSAAIFGLLVLGLAGYATALYASDNFHVVVAGQAYRSAQPSGADIAAWHEAYGIRTIINLRGAHPELAWYRAEKGAATRAGIEIVDYPISARRMLTPDQVAGLIRIMRNATKPILIHCNSGADRSGIAAALYIAAIGHGSERRAEAQMMPWYGHIPLWFLPAFAMDRTWERSEPGLGYFGS